MPNETEGRIPLADLLVFHQLARSLTSSFDLDTILRTILEHMERIVEAELWTLLMLDDESQELYYAIAAGGKHEALKNLRVKVGEGVAGWVVEHGETLIVPETEDDPRLSEEQSPGPQKARSVIAMPLRGRKGTHGAIEIFNPRAEQMTDYTIAFLHILADHAAIAIENARDVTSIQQLTITDDCTGLYNARHLYDVLDRELMRCSRQKSAGEPGLSGSGPLQAGERRARAPDRQRAVAAHRPPAARFEPQAGPVFPLWRRRIRHPDAGDRRQGRTGAGHGAASRVDGDRI